MKTSLKFGFDSNLTARIAASAAIFILAATLRADVERELPYVVPLDQRESPPERETVFEAVLTGDRTGTRTPAQALARLRTLIPSIQLIAGDGDGQPLRVSITGSQLEAATKIGLSFEQIERRISTVAGPDSTMSIPLPAIVADSDGDGLSDAEEKWWGTNPRNSDTDQDGVTDGEEIRRARAGDKSAGIPWPTWPNWGQRPNSNIGWGWGDDTEAPINDVDMDCIPDAAERFVLGFNPYYESTDNDRYDDGQEFWGITQLGHGALPRAVDSDFLLGELPSFVDQPGRSPLVATYPDIRVNVAGDSVNVVIRQTIKTENRQVNEQEITTNTTSTVESRSEIENINTLEERNRWKSGPNIAPPTIASAKVTPAEQPSINLGILNPELPSVFNGGPAQKINSFSGITDLSRPQIGGTSFLNPIGRYSLPLAHYENAAACAKLDADFKDLVSSDKFRTGVEVVSEVSGGVSAVSGVVALSVAAAPVAAPISAISGLLSFGGGIWGDYLNSRNSTRAHSLLNSFYESGCDDQGYTISDEIETRFPVEYLTTLEKIRNPQSIPAPVETGARTAVEISANTAPSGSSTRTTSVKTKNSESRKVKTSTTNRIFNRTEWSQATSSDTNHAADLKFTLNVQNRGTDVARRLTTILVNFYLGDDRYPFYSSNLLSSSGGLGTVTNLFPGSSITFTSPLAVPLSLEQLKRFDSGDGVRIVVERIEYGDDQLFYENAYTGGVFILVDNGVTDGDASQIPFLVPTWGTETYMDVLSRLSDVFSLAWNEDGSLASAKVPKISAQGRITGFETFSVASNARWGLVSNLQEDVSTAIAQPETTLQFVYSADTDRDGFVDEEELLIGTNPRDAQSFPAAQVSAGYVTETDFAGSRRTLLVLENNGNLAATNLEAVMFTSDGQATIVSNMTLGGSTILPGQRIVVGPRYKGPDINSWRGTAMPRFEGVYAGTERVVFSFSVVTGGNVGIAGSTALIRAQWGSTGSADLNIGAGYEPNKGIAVGSTGMRISLSSGRINAGDVFTIIADPYSDALIAAPGGATGISVKFDSGPSRLVIQPNQILANRTSNLSTTAAPMGTHLALGTVAAIRPNSSHAFQASVYIAEDALVDGSVRLELVDPARSGNNIIWSHLIERTFTRGWNQISIPFTPTQSSPAMVLGEQYLLLATLADKATAGGLANPISRSAAALVMLPTDYVADVGPQITGNSITLGSVDQGAIVTRIINLANTGMDTLEFVIQGSSDAISTSLPANSGQILPGQSVAVQIRIDTSKLPNGPSLLNLPILLNAGTLPPIVVSLTTGAAGAGVQTAAVPGWPWRRTVSIPGPHTQGEVIPVRFDSALNEAGMIPLFVSQNGSIMGTGRFTRTTEIPWLLDGSHIRPASVYFKLPANIPVNTTAVYEIEMGKIGRFTDGMSIPTVRVPSAALANLRLELLPLLQQILPSSFEGGGGGNSGSNIGNGGSIGSYQTDSLINLNISTASEDGRTATSAVHAYFSEDLRALGVTTARFDFERSGQGTTQLLLQGVTSCDITATTGSVEFRLINPAIAEVRENGNLIATWNVGTGPLKLGLSHSYSSVNVVHSGNINVRRVAFDEHVFAPTSGAYNQRSVGGSESDNTAWGVAIQGFSPFIEGEALTVSGRVSNTSITRSRSAFFQIKADLSNPVFQSALFYLANGNLIGNFVGPYDYTWIGLPQQAPVAQPVIGEYGRTEITAGSFSPVMRLNGSTSDVRSVTITPFSAGDPAKSVSLWNSAVPAGAASGLRDLPLEFTAVGVSGPIFALRGLQYEEQSQKTDVAVSSVAVTGVSAQGAAVGSTVNFRVNLVNNGMIAANGFTAALYDGDPALGGTLLTSVWIADPLGGAGNSTSREIIIPWTVSGRSGYRSIYVLVDPGQTLNEASRSNNTGALPAGSEFLVAYKGTTSIDSGRSTGNGADVPYTKTNGYGYEKGVAFSWGDGVNDTTLESARISIDGEVTYRFENLDPNAPYNLDVAFYQPDAAPVSYQVFSDNTLLRCFVANTEGGAAIEASTIDLNQNGRGMIAFASTAVPTRDLADGSLRVTVRSSSSLASVSHIQVRRGNRIFVDSGRSGLNNGKPWDPDFAANVTDGATGIRYGYFNSSPAATSLASGVGNASGDTVRFTPTGRLGYKFSGLDPAKAYVIALSLRGDAGTYSKIELGAFPVVPAFALSPEVQTAFVLADRVRWNNADNSLLVTLGRVDSGGNSVVGASTVVDIELREFTAAATITADADGDGLPDYYELSLPQALSASLPDATIDSDGDGQSNAVEFQAGTNPSDSTSSFVAEDLAFSTDGTQLTVSWASHPGHIYSVEASQDLVTWTVVGSNIAASPTGKNTYKVVYPGAQVFVRIGVTRVLSL